jgi:MFS family permease
VLNAYAIIFAALLVPAGRLADHFGRRRFLLVGVAVFTLASAACARPRRSACWSRRGPCRPWARR